MVQDFTREKQRLEAEIAAQRATWEQESDRVERERKEQEEAHKKQRQREIDDYEYKKNLERKKAQDKYDEDVRQVEKKNAEKQESLEKSWKQREAALKEQEEELSRLRKESADLPARLQKEAAAAAAQARSETEARLEQQTLVLRKDAEAEQRLGELRVKTLDETGGPPAGSDRGPRETTRRRQATGPGHSLEKRSKAQAGRKRCRTSTRSPWNRPRTGPRDKPGKPRPAN